MKALHQLTLALIAFTYVEALEFSTLTICANLAKSNDMCKDKYESCGHFLIKEAISASEVDEYQYGCILSRWCNKKGVYKG